MLPTPPSSLVDTPTVETLETVASVQELVSRWFETDRDLVDGSREKNRKGEIENRRFNLFTRNSPTSSVCILSLPPTSPKSPCDVEIN